MFYSRSNGISTLLQVMTTVYGVTYIGARDQIERQLKDLRVIQENDSVDNYDELTRDFRESASTASRSFVKCLTTVLHHPVLHRYVSRALTPCFPFIHDSVDGSRKLYFYCVLRNRGSQDRLHTHGEENPTRSARGWLELGHALSQK